MFGKVWKNVKKGDHMWGSHILALT